MCDACCKGPEALAVVFSFAVQSSRCFGLQPLAARNLSGMRAAVKAPGQSDGSGQ
jgi:hypothetical protein